MHCCIFVAKRLGQRATMLLDTYITYLVLKIVITFHVFKAVID